MRLTKHLKAQASNMKFASKIPTNADFLPKRSQKKTRDKHNEHIDSIIGNDKQDNSRPLIFNRQESFDDVINDLSNSNILINNSKQNNMSTIMTSSHTHDCLDVHRQTRSIQTYQYDNDDHVNASSIQDEQIMLSK
jgi:hypothetical protein